MNKQILFASALAVLGLTSCEKELTDDIGDVGSGQVKNSLLQVRTRGSSPGSEATVAYPLQVYVFQGDECRAAQTIGDEGQTLNIALTEGTYTVYAVGGASTADYVLPTTQDALTTTALALQEGHDHGDLMTASATATLVDGGTNTVTLGLQRKTMLLQNIEIKKVPTAATAVSVTLAPLWQLLCVGGTFSGTAGSKTIALTKQENNRMWTAAANVHLLPPSSSPASISVNITIGGATKTYTYSCSDQLEAGYKIHIDGTYTEAVGVTLTGTITGATWLGERTISFEFDESGSSATDDGGNTVVDGSAVDNADFPAVGSTYQGCYVLAVSVIDENSAELTLLSPNEQYVWSASNANTALAALGVDGISDWSIPNKAQMDAFYAAKDDITPAPAGQRYLWQEGTEMKQRYMSDGSDGSASYSGNASYLRPVAVVSITKD